MNPRAVLDVDRWADRYPLEGAGPTPQDPPPPVDRAPIGVAAIVLTGLVVGTLATLGFLGVLDDDASSELADADGSSIEAGDTNDDAEQLVDDDAPAATSAPSTAAPDAADDAEPVDGTTTDDVTTDDVTTDDGTAADGTTDDGTSEEGGADTAIDDASSGELSPRELAAALLDAPRSAVFSGGVVFLRGSVPSAEVGEEIAARAAAVVGPENVVNEYTIDPSTPLVASAPLYVEDVILFDLDSSTLNPAFVPLLELGTSLMTQIPTVEIVVIAHTDSTGDAAYNLELSERRAEAVKAFWVESGIAAERVTAIGLGEEAPALSNLGATGRAANRRAEFIVQGILG